jgi:medium-chain acyl-[acyl-carrier-protein] hydrolase
VGDVNGVWIEKGGVRSVDLDPHGRLKLLSIAGIFQEGAAEHARHLGVDYYTLIPEDLAWVLARLYIEVGHLPGWRADFELQTWPAGNESLFAYRDFLLESPDKSVIAKGVSSWIVIHPSRRIPARKHGVFSRFHVPKRERVLDRVPVKLDGISEWDTEKTFEVRYHDIDINGHVNHTHYLQWAQESMTYDFLSANIPVSIEINFLAETVFGDGIVCRTRKLDGHGRVFLQSVVNTHNGKELARIKTVWRNEKE